MADQVDAGTLLPAATVFTASGAIGPGCRRPDVERLVRRGHWHRLRRDVLCHEDVWQRADERERHLLLCAGVLGTSSKTLVLSHLSAAWLWQLPMPSARPEVVTVTDASVRSRTARRRSGVVVHGTPLHGDEYVESGWLRLTTVARTVADCLRHVGLADGVAMADAALRSGAVTGPDLSGAFERQTGWPGARRLARARSLVDGRRESWLESRSAVVMAEVGIPSPEWQVTVLDHRGRFVARADALWPRLGVLGEADGLGKYAADAEQGEDGWRSALRREKQREDRLRDLGFEVVRWIASDLDRPADLRRRFESAVARGDPGRITAGIRTPRRLGLPQP